MQAPSNLEFLGAAGTVTGSRTLLTSGTKKILVDCGLFQGVKSLRVQNWDPFPVHPASIDSLLLTHAHLDHCGYIPLLVRNGFRGKIHATPPTRDLADIILRDSGKIQEEDAERANRHAYTHHTPAKPLYTLQDAIRAMGLFVTHELHEWVSLSEETRFQFLNSGHILGSAMILLESAGTSLVFTGDLGRTHPILLPPPEKVPFADALVLESTYGDRTHPGAPGLEQLQSAIRDTYQRGGTLMIPTFTVERAQEILYFLLQIKNQGALPAIPVYLDSPMGVSVTAIMAKYPGWNTLSAQDCRSMESIAHMVSDIGSSKAALKDPRQKIVLAGSGMIEGGRILHYLNQYLGGKENMVLLVGYQAEGTRGRALKEGAREIKFFGQNHLVRAEIREIPSLSGHADQSELLDWLKGFTKAPGQIFLNHGEPGPSEALQVKIREILGWTAIPAIRNQPYPIRSTP